MRLVRALVIVNCVSIHVLPGTRPSRQTTQQTTREILGLNDVEKGVKYPVAKKEMAQKGHKSLLSQGVSNGIRTRDLRNHNPAL